MTTRARALARHAALVAVAGALGCGSPPPPPPSPVIEASPTAICLGDDFRTDVRLDGRKSTPSLTLVYTRPDPSEPPLEFQWSFSGAEVRVEDGDVSDDHLVVRTAGDRPLHVRLRVKNASGGVAEALISIAVTPPDALGRCPLPAE